MKRKSWAEARRRAAAAPPASPALKRTRSAAARAAGGETERRGQQQQQPPPTPPAGTETCVRIAGEGRAGGVRAESCPGNFVGSCWGAAAVLEGSALQSTGFGGEKNPKKNKIMERRRWVLVGGARGQWGNERGQKAAVPARPLKGSGACGKDAGCACPKGAESPLVTRLPYSGGTKLPQRSRYKTLRVRSAPRSAVTHGSQPCVPCSISAVSTHIANCSAAAPG